MSSKKIVTFTIIVLLLANLGLLLFMTMNPLHPRNGMQNKFNENEPKNRIIKRLGFNEEQSELFSVLARAHRDTTIKFDEKIKVDKKLLFSLLAETTPNIAIADSLTSNIARSQKQIELLHFNHFKKVKALCKGEQIEKFNTLSKDLARLFDRKKPLPKKRKKL
jgi:hypothetical protein